MDEAPDSLDPDDVRDRESFLAFARALAADRRASAAAERKAPGSPYGPEAGGWENATIEAFLEAAVSWAEDAGKSEGPGVAVGAVVAGLRHVPVRRQDLRVGDSPAGPSIEAMQRTRWRGPTIFGL